ncbi:MAG: hypothetical protein EBT95_00615 [Verrucomicrobia bacterium]|nr:hypothetical protein [Verrucomicrobiota bacterium]
MKFVLLIVGNILFLENKLRTFWRVKTNHHSVIDDNDSASIKPSSALWTTPARTEVLKINF